MINNSRCREKVEGKKSRRRWYKCRLCYTLFQVDSARPLPVKARYCNNCQTSRPIIAKIVVEAYEKEIKL